MLKMMRIGLAVLAAVVAAPRDGVAPLLDESPGIRRIYEPEDAAALHRDVLTLQSGEKIVGKVLEWGPVVSVYDGSAGPRSYSWEDVRGIQLRPDPKADNRAVLPDLTVASIERKPNGPNGSRIVVHVLNAGGAAVGGVECTISVDGTVVKKRKFDGSLAPGAAGTVEAEWSAPSTGRELQVDLETGTAVKEIAHWNNHFVEPVGGVPLIVAIAKDRYARFQNSRNLVDSFCFEDWLNYHVRVLNRLFEQSISSAAPQGITERVRVERIIVADVLRADDPHTRNTLLKSAGLDPAAAPMMLVLSDADPLLAIGSVDWSLIRRIGGELGLVDLARVDMPVSNCMVRDSHGDFVQREFRAPWPADVMYPGGSRLFSELEAAYLNRVVGRPHRTRGEYLSALPAACGLVILGNDGKPAAGVDVAVFQRTAAGPNAGQIVGPEIFLGQAGADGRFPLPPRSIKPIMTANGYGQTPNPWSQISPDGVNGLFLVRIRRGESEEYHFVSLLDFCLACVRGRTAAFEYTIRTHLAAPGTPDPPQYLRAQYDETPAPIPAAYLLWNASKTQTAMEYRVYVRVGRSVDEWKLVDIVSAERVGYRGALATSVPIEAVHSRGWESVADPGTTFAVSCVDRQGREGPLSPIAFLPAANSQCAKLAISPGGNAYFALAGPLRNGLVRTSQAVFDADFGLRTTRFPGYEPWVGGMAFDFSGKLIMADPHNHQVGWFDRAELTRLVGGKSRSSAAAGDKPGEFKNPSDVALDEKGRIYVADTGNNRVQVLDADGKFMRIFGEGDTPDPDQFRRPAALGCWLSKLCVTDLDGTRVQIFDVSADKPRLVRVLRDVEKADRALVGESGRVYVLGGYQQTHSAVLIYPIHPAPDFDKPERLLDRMPQGWVRGPRGLYPDGKGYSLFVNEYPFVLHKLMLE